MTNYLKVKRMVQDSLRRAVSEIKYYIRSKIIISTEIVPVSTLAPIWANGLRHQFKENVLALLNFWAITLHALILGPSSTAIGQSSLLDDQTTVMPQLPQEVPSRGRRGLRGGTLGPEPELSRALPQGGLDHFRLLRS